MDLPTVAIPSGLPVPGGDAHAHGLRVQAMLRARIQAAGGWLPFEDWMQAALYAPGLGYYSAGSGKFGGQGDFITAPEAGHLFGQALARQVAEAEQRAARLRELLLARKEYTFILDETNCPPVRLTSEDARTIRRLEAAEKACEVHGDLAAAPGDTEGQQ